MKPFKVDENSAEMNMILNEREDVVLIIRLEKRMMFREWLKKSYLVQQKNQTLECGDEQKESRRTKKDNII